MRILLLTLMLSASVCFAQTPALCPWFSTGSAENVLGGTVSLALHIESNSQGECRFTRTTGSERGFIEITIGKVDSQACLSGSSKVTALGNEAVQCRVTRAGGQNLDIISGRLRDAYFVVKVGNLPGAAEAPVESARSRDPYSASVLERIAEQVLGNLY